MDKTLSEKYGVDKSFDLGSVKECVRQRPTRFGDVTSTHWCSIIAAKVYYPKFTTFVQKYTNNGTGMSVDKTEDRIQYVNRAGKSIEDYVQFGMPVPQISGERMETVEDRLGINASATLSFSGLAGFAIEEGQRKVNGKWLWSEGSGLGYNSPGADLQNALTQKVFAGEAFNKDTPTIEKAFEQGTAPLIVFYNLRYCHSPSIVFLDDLCILPN